MRGLIVIFALFFFHCGYMVDLYTPVSGTQTVIPSEMTDKHNYRFDTKGHPGFPEKIIFLDERKIWHLASHDPCFPLFSTKKLMDDRRSIVDILKDSLAQSTGIRLKKEKTLTVRINRFIIQSRDRCVSNTVEVDVDIEVFTGIVKKYEKAEPLYHFKKTEKIKTPVTTMYLYSIIWTFPTVIKAGFHGNRQDQINYLGRRALGEFIDGLQNILGDPQQDRTLEQRGESNNV